MRPTRTAVIERAWVDDARVVAGREVRRARRQSAPIPARSGCSHQSVAIPANATGTLQLVVSDGPRLGHAGPARGAPRRAAAGVADRSRRQPGAPQQPHLRPAHRRRPPARSSTASRCPACRPRWPAVIDGDRPSSGATDAAGRAARRMGDSRRSSPSPARASSRSPSSRERPGVRRLSRLSHPSCAVPSSLCSLCAAAAATLSAGPQFWRAATQADFLKGDLEQLAVDEHGRLTLGPDHHPRVRRQRALRLDGGGRARADRCSSAPATTARCSASTAAAAARCSTMRRSCRPTPCCRGPTVGAGRHLARRPRLPVDARARPASSSIPTRNTSGRWPPTTPAGSTSPPAIPRARLPRGRRRAPARRSTRRAPRTSSRWPSTPSGGWSSAPSRRAGSSGSTPRAGRSCCSTPTCRRCARCVSTRAAASTWWRRPAAPAAAGATAGDTPTLPEPPRAAAGGRP